MVSETERHSTNYDSVQNPYAPSKFKKHPSIVFKNKNFQQTFYRLKPHLARTQDWIDDDAIGRHEEITLLELELF